MPGVTANHAPYRDLPLEDGHRSVDRRHSKIKSACSMLGAAIVDPHAPPQTVDYVVGIAIFLACAVSRRNLIQQPWLARARIAAQHSDVPATWLLATASAGLSTRRPRPGGPREWTRRALDANETLPLIEPRLSVATWSQLWDCESPALAALRMRELVLEQADRGHGDDQTVLVACVLPLTQ